MMQIQDPNGMNVPVHSTWVLPLGVMTTSP
jgi:hypothetical protein